MSKLLLVRHGETESNSAQRIQGQRDVELNAVGLRQVERLRDRLAKQRLDVIYSSDLQRALVTAKTVASGHQLEIVTCPELREIDFGKFDGLTFAEISQRYPEMAKLWSDWNPKMRFPGGESVDELNTRVSKFLDRLKRHTPEETLLIVAHSAPLRLIICLLLGIELRHWRQFRLDLASLSIVETYPQGRIINLLNDTSYL
ncbi:histidine phosphatase family protein [Chloroflexota bacterium]